MIRYPESRSVRRAQKRAARAEALEKRARQDPRSGEDRRAEQRRTDPPLSGAALDARLRELGIGEDRRRHNDRRDHDRRRR